MSLWVSFHLPFSYIQFNVGYNINGVGNIGRYNEGTIVTTDCSNYLCKRFKGDVRCT